MFRQLANEGNQLGVEARDKYWGKGNLVPDEITIGLVKERLKKKTAGTALSLTAFRGQYCRQKH